MSYPAWWCQWCVCLYTHQCVCVACAYYMYAFVSSPDHSLRPGELPGEAPGIYLSLPEYHGVWRRQHPLPEGGMWRVSLRVLQQTDLLGKSSRKLSFKQILRLFFAELQHKTFKRLFLVFFTSVPMVLVYVSLCPSACCGQLGRIWALQLLWPAVCVGERRVSSLGILERQQCLPHWEDDVLPPHLLGCECLSPSLL